ncbi:MAG: cyclic nucleotide-binding domain-containing protein [Ktedonobacteraceae bacterium]
MQTLEALLTDHPFFQGLKPEHIQFIAGCGKNARFDAGTYLLREGEAAADFYIIQHGKVALEVLAAQRGRISIETIEAGEVLGWSWLFPPYRWHFSARAVEPVRAIVLDGACLRRKCDVDHDLGYELTQRVAHILMQRLQATRLQLLDVYNVQKQSRA